MYNIDKDITLYSLEELKTMERIWNNKNANHSSIPFSFSEIVKEINKRTNKS